MVFKMMIDAIIAPKRIINAKRMNRYDFLRINIIYYVLLAISACINTRMNLYNFWGRGFSVILFGVAFLSFVSYAAIYLSICGTYLVHLIKNDRKIKFYDFRGYMFPFCGSFFLIRMWIVLLLQVFGTPEIIISVVGLLVELCLSYPIYLLLKKYGTNKKNIYFVLIANILLTSLGVI